jgi:PAS domain S-box-containing protein
MVGTAAGLLLSLLVFILLFLGMYRAELTNERTEAVSQVNQLLRTSLENAMLKRDLDGLRSIVSGLGQQDNVVAVMIANPAGEVRFSDSLDNMGRQFPVLGGVAEQSTRFVHDENGKEVLRSINPVLNRAPCQECHGPIEKHPVNGVLYVDYDAASLRKHARSTTLVLMGTGALIVLLNISGGWWFIRRYVLLPISKLSQATEKISGGDLDVHVDLPGNDELAQLGQAFNRMSDNLRDTLQQLEEKEAFLQSLIDAIPDGVRIIDSDYRIRLANQSYRQQLGLEGSEGLGACYHIPHGRSEPCVPTMITCPLHELKEQDRSLKVLHRHRRCDGSRMNVEIYASRMQAITNGKPESLVVEAIRDLDKEVRYSQEQKLTELGRLATGVAHEIHNPLASLRFALHAVNLNLSEESKNNPVVIDYFDLVDKEVDKCIEVTERLLKLSIIPACCSELVALEQVLRDTLSLLNWEAQEEGVEMIFDFEPGLRVMAKDSEMRMAAFNLAQNAFHAMVGGGRLEVFTRRSDGHVEIGFRDTGVGIDLDNIKNIFDPFFSRRADNRAGTGLGLSITRSIVESHGGEIKVDTEPGVGSCFIIRMPDPDRVSGVV